MTKTATKLDAGPEVIQMAKMNNRYLRVTKLDLIQDRRCHFCGSEMHLHVKFTDRNIYATVDKGGLTPGSLEALTVIHNHLSTREDGTTATERFYKQKPWNLFEWLVERLLDLPRLAAKRPRKDSLAPASLG